MTTPQKQKFPAVSHVLTSATFVVAALLCLLLMIGYFLWISYQHAMLAAESETRNLVEVIESKLTSEFSHVDGMLTLIVSEVQSEPFHRRSTAVYAAQKQYLVRMVTSFPELAGLNIFDADGMLQMSSEPNIKPFSIFDNSHFKTLRDNRHVSLVFSEPLITRSTGILSLILSRSIRDDAGRFLGTANAMLHIDTFSALFRSLEVGQNGVVLLRRSDNFKLIARIPRSNEGDFNQPIPANDPIRQRIESGARRGTLTFTASTDGLRRIASFAKLDERFPFYVQVALSKDHYLAAWRRQVIWIGLFVVPLLLVFAIALVRLNSNRKAAVLLQKELSDRGQRLSSIIEGTNIGTWEWNVQSGETLFNERWADIIGYTLNELSPISVDTWLKACHPDDLKHSGELLDKHFAKELASYECEYRMRHKDGHWVWVQDRGKVRSWAVDGKPLLMSGTHQDITVRRMAELEWLDAQTQLEEKVEQKTNHLKQALELLHTSAEKYRLLLDESGDPIFSVTPDIRYSYVNSAFATPFGKTPEQMIGRTPHEVMSAKDADFRVATLKSVVAQGQEKTVVVPHTDGIRWFLTTLKPIFNDSHHVISLLCISKDITHQKQIEQSLHDSQLRLELATAGANEGIWDVNLNTGDLYHSPEMYQMLGYTSEELPTVRTAWDAITHPDDAVQFRDRMLAHFKDSASPFDVIVRLRHRDGDWHFIQSRGRASRDANGHAIRFTGTHIDVTQRMQSEKDAKAASLAKSEFLANMSHEIRTPMNGVIGMVDLLQQTDLSHEQQRMLCTIHQSSLALLTIINDILDFSKIEAGKLTIEHIATPLHDVAQDVVNMMTGAAKAKSIDLSVWIDPAMPQWVFSDPTRLRQVLINLIGNAIKFTRNLSDRAGQVSLRVELCTLDNGHPGIHLRVIDNGEGMSDEVVKRLFQPFTQADSSTSRKHGGTGLGLSISTQLVKLMGGQIRVYSKMFQGSEFTVELPLLLAPQGQKHVGKADRRSRQRTPAPSIEQAASSGKLILLADDNETNRDVIYAQLHLLGYAAEVAEDGVAALEKWRTGRFALLMTDCHMPLMDGFELTTFIRFEEGSDHHLPIIAVTANAMQGEAKRCLDSGMDDYLSKPLRMDELGPMLAKWLPLESVDQATATVSSPIAESDDKGQPSDMPIWDANALGKLVGNELVMHKRLLEKFLKNAQAQVTALNEAAQVGNLQRLAEVAHPLKSAARTVGAWALGDLCERIEAAATAKDSSVSLALLTDLASTFEQAKQQIDAHLNLSVLH